jgi:cytochrome bd-type quinol oxidase subunit 2
MDTEPWSKAIPGGLKRIILPIPPRDGVIPLRELRSTVLGYAFSLLIVLGVLLALGPFEPDQSTVGWLVFGGASIVSLVLLVQVRRSSRAWLVAASTEEMADRSYSQRLNLCVVYSVSIALTGFVVVFLHDDLVTYLIGLPISLALLAWIAPRRADIAALQEEIAGSGSPVNLWDALTTPRTWSARDESKRKGKRS